MKFGINTLDDVHAGGKTVLLRVDINQPIDRAAGQLRDTTRIMASLPTIRELSEQGAKVVLLAHQGSDIEYKSYYTTAPHARVLAEGLGREVKFIDDVCGPAARAAIGALENGEILLLDNVRFVAEEQTLFELNLKLSHAQQAETLLVRKLAPLADLYVCDAFAAAHRDQPSLCGFEQVLPSAMGRLFEKEYCTLFQLMENPAHPCVFVLGGAKIGDAFRMMEAVLAGGAADRVLCGGLVGNVMLWASGGGIGVAGEEYIRRQGFEELLAPAKELLAAHAERIALPCDLAWVENGARREAPPGSVPEGALAVDVGSKTAARYAEEILAAKTVFVNGPMGVFEEEASGHGTKAVWDALGKTTATTVVGGGDSIAATNRYGKTALIDEICTGGGALIRFLSGEELPVVTALRHGSRVAAGQRTG